jgi:putative ABC transport system permease protein
MITLAYNWIQDFRHGLRSIKKSKGLALGVVVSMALGMGATASILSVVDSFVLRPLSVSATGRVVRSTN